MEIEGVAHDLVMTLAAEVGFDLAKSFPSAKHFTSWMGLSPNKRITGGRLLSSKSQKNKSRLANSFRSAANALGRQRDTPLSDFFRRIAFKKGRKVAITATARKLAVVIYNMLVHQESYRPEDLEQYRERMRLQKIKYIQRTIKKLEVTPSDLFLV